MAKKKTAKPAAIKKTVKKGETRPEAPRKTAGKKKLPAIKAADRVTKRPVKAVKTTSESVPSAAISPLDQPRIDVATSPAPQPPPPASQRLADLTEPHSVPACPSQCTGPVSQEAIQYHAYLKWEAAGRPPGDGACFWIEAELELLQQG